MLTCDVFVVQPCHPTPKTMPTRNQDFKIRKYNRNEGTGWQHPQQQGTLTLQASRICSPKIVNANLLLRIQAASLQAWQHTDSSTRCTAKQFSFFSPCQGSVMLTRGQACGSSAQSTSLRGTILKLALIGTESSAFWFVPERGI